MSAIIMEEQLVAALEDERSLADLGCVVERAAAGGVTVTCRSARIGTWSWRGGFFVFAPAARGAPERRVETVAEAVRHTRRVIGK